MKKLLITTALVLTISSNANAYDRFLKFRQQAEPSVEVNYGALQYLQPDLAVGIISTAVRPEEIKKRPAKPYNAPAVKAPAAPQAPATKIVVANPVEMPAQIPAKMTTQAPVAQIVQPQALSTPAPQVVNMPKPAPQIVHPNQAPSAEKLALPPVKAEIPALPKPIEPLKAIEKPAPQMPTTPKAPVAAPKNAAESLPLEMPKLAPEPPKMPAAPAIVPPANLKPVTNQPLPEIVEKPELVMPKLAPEPSKMPAIQVEPIIPALKELPKLPTPPAPNANEVVLPPLFPTNSASAPTAPTTPPAPTGLPPLKALFTENSDKVEMPQIPSAAKTNDLKPAEVLPNIPAPKIADVQVNKDVSKAPVLVQLPTQAAAKEVNFTFPFNETETELPLSEQTRLAEVAETLKSDKNMALTVNAYASGTAEQSSQAKRTSLARALSVRRFMLERNVPSEQIVIRPYGNESGNGVPDRVDIKVGKKVGA